MVCFLCSVVAVDPSDLYWSSAKNCLARCVLAGLPVSLQGSGAEEVDIMQGLTPLGIGDLLEA